MGLDITVYKGLEPADLRDLAKEPLADSSDLEDRAYDAGWVRIWVNPDFPDRELPLKEGWHSARDSWHFRAGPYSYYSRYRAALCRMALGVEPEEVWNDPVAYITSPFFEQIHFSDCEGTIGQHAASRLAHAYATWRERALVELDERDAEKYKCFAEAFRDAAETGGAVVFR